MINIGTERRKAERISADYLPESLKHFNINVGTNETILAKTLDLSEEGMALSVPICIKDIDSIFITIHMLDKSIMIKDQILSTRSIDQMTSRVNILFTKNNPFFKLIR
ncbi:MAG: hypothetical protein JXJ04_19620 [Spirochaetales bacterium]|nr:hypothetical protein [Spirochaetales bacterium]